MTATESAQGERQRILEMVQGGAVSPEEGERLLTLLEQRTGRRRRCPFCAEEIPADVGICPECRTPLTTAPGSAYPRRTGGGFHGLSGLGKFLVIYTFLVCAVVLLWNPLGILGIALCQKLLAVLGIIGAVLVCKGSRAGHGLLILWAALQIVPIIVRGTVLNQQFLHLGITTVTNGFGIGFNAVGLILLILFIKAVPSSTGVDYTRGA